MGAGRVKAWSMLPAGSKIGMKDGMGEKETGEPMSAGRTRHGNSVALDDDRGSVREAMGPTEPTDDAATDSGAAAQKTRHDTEKNSIGNIR